MKMKKIFVYAIVFLSVVAGVFAQEAVSEQASAQENQVVIKFNVLDPEWTPKIYVSKYANFMGKKLIATGSGEVTLDNASQFGYIGFSKTSVQQLNVNSDFLEFDVERGNAVLNNLGVAGTIVGCVACGVGLGFLMIGVMDGDNSVLVPFGSLAAGGLGIAIGGFVLSNKNKPKLIPVTR